MEAAVFAREHADAAVIVCGGHQVGFGELAFKEVLCDVVFPHVFRFRIGRVQRRERLLEVIRKSEEESDEEGV